MKGAIPMTIRPAVSGDIPRLLCLLQQVLELHARIRPDIFIPHTTKYTACELEEILRDSKRPVYVASDETGQVLGYAFCVVKEQPFSNNMVPFTSLFIDDLCVDAGARGQGVGRALFAHVTAQAKAMGCYEVTLNVWQGNDSARAFYERMGLRVKEMQMEYILDKEGDRHGAC
jgi:ribosomal protein S18 acetylase RimI-like enzyme